MSIHKAKLITHNLVFRMPMFIVGSVIIVLTYAILKVSIHAAYKHDIKTFSMFVSIGWILSIVATLLNAMFLFLRRQKRFLLLLIAGLVMVLFNAYLRSGGV
jgi:hypothetical protein